MKRLLIYTFLCILLLSCATVSSLGIFPTLTPTAAQPPLPTLTATVSPARTVTSTPPPSLTPSPAPGYSSGAFAYGPSNFPANVDPLTGLEVKDPSILRRRPLLVKVSNLPRSVRPQWGLSLADQVYEYYTEEGATRFTAVFYGQDATMVGPIRSARLFDNHLMTMYKANFAFASADYRALHLLFKQDYADRLVIEAFCPPMCRYKPNSANLLVTNTVDLTNYINGQKVKGSNGRQNLDGLAFSNQPPSSGAPARRVTVRYSAAIYNRWDYDPATGKYQRFSDQENDFDAKKETYAPLIDRLTKQQISADNVLVLYTNHKYFSQKPEVIDITLSGPDKAILFRDGQAFQLRWQSAKPLDALFNLVSPDGQTFPLKPGNTFIEVVGASTKLAQNAPEWRFTFQIP
ncbi:MAG: DUF3048 domain-containing protein [Anaerolineales bacterium]